jgi:hypothetical protein
MSRAKDIEKKNSLILKIKRRVRGSINAGTAEMPRVTVFRSNKYLTSALIENWIKKVVATPTRPAGRRGTPLGESSVRRCKRANRRERSSDLTRHT